MSGEKIKPMKSIAKILFFLAVVAAVATAFYCNKDKPAMQSLETQAQAADSNFNQSVKNGAKTVANTPTNVAIKVKETSVQVPTKVKETSANAAKTIKYGPPDLPAKITNPSLTPAPHATP